MADEGSACEVFGGVGEIMIELHGWLTIRPTYMDEDKHPEIDEELIYKEVEMLVESLRLRTLDKVKWKNGICHIDISYFSNHYYIRVLS